MAVEFWLLFKLALLPEINQSLLFCEEVSFRGGLWLSQPAQCKAQASRTLRDSWDTSFSSSTLTVNPC